jgi:hypothetical protein
MYLFIVAVSDHGFQQVFLGIYPDMWMSFTGFTKVYVPKSVIASISSIVMLPGPGSFLLFLLLIAFFIFVGNIISLFLCLFYRSVIYSARLLLFHFVYYHFPII